MKLWVVESRLKGDSRGWVPWFTSSGMAVYETRKEARKQRDKLKESWPQVQWRVQVYMKPMTRKEFKTLIGRISNGSSNEFI